MDREGSHGDQDEDSLLSVSYEMSVMIIWLTFQLKLHWRAVVSV